ncbi:MAG: 50S ribosomal protein L34e [Nanoarchaeota archaeon]|nr:50S ribosomal protein L34e [Nanoarchaeota archaeon]
MPRGMYRSRTLRRVFNRVPGGESKLVYKQRKPGVARCAQTGEPLHGIPRGTPKQLAKLSKTQKRPQRPFGGVLSSRAMRDVLKLEVREQQPSQE